MCLYDVIVALMNIHEMKSQITNHAISGVSHVEVFGNQFLSPMSASFFTKSKPLDMTFKLLTK